MTCQLEHVTAATVQRLIREREEALQEVQTLDAENERLQDELKRAKFEEGTRMLRSCAEWLETHFPSPRNAALYFRELASVREKSGPIT